MYVEKIKEEIIGGSSLLMCVVNTTVDLEIFIVKNFSWLSQTTKINYSELYYVGTTNFRV